MEQTGWSIPQSYGLRDIAHLIQHTDQGQCAVCMRLRTEPRP